MAAAERRSSRLSGGKGKGEKDLCALIGVLLGLGDLRSRVGVEDRLCPVEPVARVSRNPWGRLIDCSEHQSTADMRLHERGEQGSTAGAGTVRPPRPLALLGTGHTLAVEQPAGATNPTRAARSPYLDAQDRQTDRNRATTAASTLSVARGKRPDVSTYPSCCRCTSLTHKATVKCEEKQTSAASHSEPKPTLHQVLPSSSEGDDWALTAAIFGRRPMAC